MNCKWSLQFKNLQIQLQTPFFHSEAKICEEIVMVQVISYVEDERCFNNLN
jgi:hypothetical protein